MRAFWFGMDCKAQTAKIPKGIARICNAAGRPKQRCARREGLFQRCLSLLAAAVALAACAPMATTEAARLSAGGQSEEALRVLERARQDDPKDVRVRAAWLRERELIIARWVGQAEAQRQAGRMDLAAQALERARETDARHPRVLAEQAEQDRARRLESALAEAMTLESQGRFADAEARARQVLSEAPMNAPARALQLRLRERTAEAALPAALGAAFQKVVTLEFRDAPLRSVLEALARDNAVNFVFDREVRSDARVTVFLRAVTIDEALRVILSTQQLDRKLLNDSTLLVYPNTVAKQREHQELVTRSFFLVNADVKQAQTMVRTMAKSRDLFIDERLNLMIVRDTPEVVRLIERMVSTLDAADPEVLLELEVLEVASTRVDELGLQWPEEISYGAIGVTGAVPLGDRRSFRGAIANPALLATLRGTDGNTNIIANPRLRARNRDKAKILIGDKLPVFTSTTAANAGVGVSVNYLEVGLKLEIEPSVQLDNEVIMKINLEVSSQTARVAGPQGSVAFQIGTRQASTSLRLRDGETQILAGLIREEDTKGVAGLPGLSSLPVAGRLFGLHTDQRSRTEVMLLITPRVVRNLALPSADVLTAQSGVDANPGAMPLRLRNGGGMRVPVGAGGAGGAAAPLQGDAPSAATAPPQAAGAVIMLATSGEVAPGETASVTLANRSPLALKGELEYDPTRLAPAQGGDARTGRLPFTLGAGGEQVMVFRTLPSTDGQATSVSVINIAPAEAGAALPLVSIQGSGAITVKKR